MVTAEELQADVSSMNAEQRRSYHTVLNPSISDDAAAARRE